jgi:hypothetical protein
MTDFVSFSNALAREGRRLVILAPGAAADPGIDGVIIGPGMVDLLADGHVDQIIVQREAGHFAGWRADDLARYYAKGV